MRLDDWEARLSAFIAAPVAFQWGVSDCALWATACAAELTGQDRAAVFRSVGYSDASGAAQALRDHGKGTLLVTMNDLFPKRTPAFAQRGDLVWHQGAVGVSMGHFGLFLPLEGQLVRIPRGAFLYAWEV